VRDHVFIVVNVFIVANARLQQRGKDDAHGSQVGVQGRHKRPQPAGRTQEWAHQGVTKCELQTCVPQKLQIDAGANTSLTHRAHPPNDSGGLGRACSWRGNNAEKSWGQRTLVVAEWTLEGDITRTANVCTAESENRCRRQH